jgi:hypothetical protein
MELNARILLLTYMIYQYYIIDGLIRTHKYDAIITVRYHCGWSMELNAGILLLTYIGLFIT